MPLETSVVQFVTEGDETWWQRPAGGFGVIVFGDIVGRPSTIIAYDVFTEQEAVIPDYIIVEETIEVRSLLSVEGIRFFFSSFVNNVASFGVIAVILVAMAGVGVAEASGLMAALIRKLVAVAPRQLIAFILIFVGVLSSVATDTQLLGDLLNLCAFRRQQSSYCAFFECLSVSCHFIASRPKITDLSRRQLL